MESEKSINNESSSLVVFALVLQKSSEKIGTYKRVGLLDHRRGSGWWKDTPVVEIVII